MDNKTIEILLHLREHMEKAFEHVLDSEQLEKLRIELLGKKGQITDALKMLKDMPAEDRREFGERINVLKAQAEELINGFKEKFQREQISGGMAGEIDITLSVKNTLGSLHPITIVTEQVVEIFRTMGFTIEDGFEIETEYNNFEAVNVPKHHPARDMQDTYFLDNGQVLKTQTSAAQNRILRKYGAPLKALFPGRCFRNESLDAGHENTFFQIEGMMVGEDISISNLIYFMKTLLSEVFKKDVKVRLRPGYFPFVEPGFELDINCLICGGVGCSTCKQSGWIELCPCGMIHPKVLEMGGVDPDKHTGFAFGLGLSRLAMMKYGIRDIRILNSGNLKALRQIGVM